jgi:hypothetical protein
MTDAQVDDLLWRTLEPLLPPRKRRPKGGRPFADDRACLMGILFVLRADRPWRDVPPRAGRERRDVLAAAAGLAGGGRVGEAPRGEPRQARSLGRARLEPSEPGLHERAR